MPGIISTPGATFDLTIDDSEEERDARPAQPDVLSILRGTQNNTHLANAVAQPNLTHQSPHHSGKKVTTTPSKSAAAGPSSRQDLSPRSTRLFQHRGQDASPRAGALNMAIHTTSGSGAPRTSTDGLALHTTPKRAAAKKEEAFNVDGIASQLRSFATEIDKTSARLIQHTIKEITKSAPARRHLSDFDDFSGMPSIAEEPGSASESALRVQFKLHVGSDKARKKNLFFPKTVLNSVKERVPKYRFHHVDISKNILTPNTQLRFVPFLRDLQAAEEEKYYKWLEELKEQDRDAGMATLALDSAAKAKAMARNEYASTLHAYLEHWIKKLGLDHLNRAALIHYMASETPDDDSAITPQQKSTLLDSDVASTDSARSHAAAKAFTEAFDRVFGQRATLRDVLMLDDVVETLLTSKKAKEPQNPQSVRDEELLRDVENDLATYALFNCLICFSHDCEHGSVNEDNSTNKFSITNTAKVSSLVRKRWTEQTQNKERAKQAVTLCKNECFQGPHPTTPAPPEWGDEEIKCLRLMFATLGKSTVRAECAVATILGRKCWDVRDKLVSLKLYLPYIQVPPEQPRAKNMPWYDRIKKQMANDFPEYTSTANFPELEIIDPCHHEGPCSPANKCPCAGNKLLCERFCQCTAENCPYKFTGCACHGSGKTCLDRKCICVLLNRECDPVLCTGCGAAERANRLNMHDDALHATCCQNVPLQRGVSKVVLMGASQLEGCGYGLFTAEDIAHDEFVIEYTGEMIKQDEGVRREARRGDVFNEASNTSYLFTLLDTEGIWVDAAIYGNLSRYINHAGDGDKRGANITPKIVYVNGEYRIRFTATRDIKTGEELFFNYGDNFPNLTEKLLEDKDVDENGRRKTGPKRKPGRPPNKTAAAAAAGNNKGKGKEVGFAPAAKRVGRPRARGNATKTAPPARSAMHDADEMDWEASEAVDDTRLEEEEEEAGTSTYFSPSGNNSRRRSVRGDRIPPMPEDADDYDEYRPEGDSQEDMEAYTLARDRQRRKAAASQAQSFLFNASNKQDSDAGVKPAVKPTTPKKKNNNADGSKPVSRRGGARPGAGRKPKNPPPKPAASAPAESSEEQEEDDEEEEIEDSYVGGDDIDAEEEDSDDVPLVETGRGYGLRRRKRKSSERDDGGASPDDGEGEGEGSFDAGSLLCGANDDSQQDDEDDEDDDDDDAIDRSRRKRQKPARYRADEQVRGTSLRF